MVQDAGYSTYMVGKFLNGFTYKAVKKFGCPKVCSVWGGAAVMRASRVSGPTFRTRNVTPKPWRMFVCMQGWTVADPLIQDFTTDSEYEFSEDYPRVGEPLTSK